MSDDDLIARGRAVTERLAEFDAGRYPASDLDWSDIPLPPEPPDDSAPHVLGSPRNGHNTPDAGRPAAHQRYPTLDWHRLFAGAPDDVDWLVPDVVARGKSYSLNSHGKQGKSLFMLDQVAAGDFSTLYVDHENTHDDLVERLQDMGHSAADLIGRVHYLSFPTMPPLDGPAGAADLIELAEHYNVDLVVIDTVSRVVAGEENSADTFRALYRHTLAPLKAKRRAVVRLDHLGKSAGTKARGSSAKSDDVDAAWNLSEQKDGDGGVFVTLKLDIQRGSIHPDQIHFARNTTPRLHHVPLATPLSPTEQKRVGECIEAMKRLNLPADAGRPKALKALREAGYQIRSDTVMAAVKARKSAKNCPEDRGGRSEWPIS